MVWNNGKFLTSSPTKYASLGFKFTLAEEHKLITTVLHELQNHLRTSLPLGYQFCYIVKHADESWFEMFCVVRTDYNHHWRVRITISGNIIIEMDGTRTYKSTIANPNCFEEITELICHNEAKQLRT